MVRILPLGTKFSSQALVLQPSIIHFRDFGHRLHRNSFNVEFFQVSMNALHHEFAPTISFCSCFLSTCSFNADFAILPFPSFSEGTEPLSLLEFYRICRNKAYPNPTSGSGRSKRQVRAVRRFSRHSTSSVLEFIPTRRGVWVSVTRPLACDIVRSVG